MNLRLPNKKIKKKLKAKCSRNYPNCTLHHVNYRILFSTIAFYLAWDCTKWS